MIFKKAKLSYDREHKKPVLRSSICTGETVAGFKELSSGKFMEVRLIKTPKDIEAFKKDYGIQEELQREY